MDPTRSPREVKVQLPANIATALHARKILTGQPIGSMIEEALRGYYAAQAMAEAGATSC